MAVIFVPLILVNRVVVFKPLRFTPKHLNHFYVQTFTRPPTTCSFSFHSEMQWSVRSEPCPTCLSLRSQTVNRIFFSIKTVFQVLQQPRVTPTAMFHFSFTRPQTPSPQSQIYFDKHETGLFFVFASELLLNHEH